MPLNCARPRTAWVRPFRPLNAQNLPALSAAMSGGRGEAIIGGPHTLPDLDDFLLGAIHETGPKLGPGRGDAVRLCWQARTSRRGWRRTRQRDALTDPDAVGIVQAVDPRQLLPRRAEAPRNGGKAFSAMHRVAGHAHAFLGGRSSPPKHTEPFGSGRGRRPRIAGRRCLADAGNPAEWAAPLTVTSCAPGSNHPCRLSRHRRAW